MTAAGEPALDQDQHLSDTIPTDSTACLRDSFTNQTQMPQEKLTLQHMPRSVDLTSLFPVS